MLGNILNQQDIKNKNIMFKNLKNNFDLDLFIEFKNYLNLTNFNCEWIKTHYNEIYNTFLNYLKKEDKILVRNDITKFLICIEKNNHNICEKYKKSNFILGKKDDNIFLYSTLLNKCVNLKNFNNRYEHFIFRNYSNKSLCILYKFFADSDKICVLYNCSFLKNLSISPRKKMLRKICRERINKCPSFFICNKQDFGYFNNKNKKNIRTKLFISIMNKQGSKGLRIDKSKNNFKNLNEINLEKYEILPAKNYIIY